VVKGKDGYRVWIEPEFHAAREKLPGNLRQRIKRLLNEFADVAKPSNSRALNVAGLDIPPEIEIRRVRLDRWRIVYAVNETEKWVWVLQIRQRPPYDYEDLQDIAERLV
jgi:mRNA interferase RelE/StbE